MIPPYLVSFDRMYKLTADVNALSVLRLVPVGSGSRNSENVRDRVARSEPLY